MSENVQDDVQGEVPAQEAGAAPISVRDDDKPLVAGVARDLINLGFEIVSTVCPTPCLRCFKGRT